MINNSIMELELCIRTEQTKRNFPRENNYNTRIVKC